MLWIAGGCLAIILCGMAASFLGLGGLMWLGSRSPNNADVQVSAPNSAGVGDQIQIIITIRNTSTETLELSSIDFSLNYLRGFNILLVEPKYSETSQFDSLGGGETFQTYYFYRTVEPGDTLIVIFDAVALFPGDFSGEVDVCIDSDFNCVTNIPRTIIK